MSFREIHLPNRRIISAVYYFNCVPKSFSGGILRIYSFVGDKDTGAFIDIEPTHDMLAFFPSWVLHEVLPVVCPSGRLEDSRFAINCWVRRQNMSDLRLTLERTLVPAPQRQMIDKRQRVENRNPSDGQQ